MPLKYHSLKQARKSNRLKPRFGSPHAAQTPASCGPVNSPLEFVVSLVVKGFIYAQTT